MKELIKYFVNLLILQYRNKPRAKGTIETLAKQTFADSTDKIFPIEVQNSYNLDTAVGKQLDVLGKYIGYDRNLPFPLNDNFVYAEYDESINPNEGYADYYEEKITKPYLEYRYSSYDSIKVSDDTYRRILKMQSELKNKPLSLANIDEALKNNFDTPEGEIYLVEGDKTVEYHISKEMYPTLNTQDKLNAFFEKYFPRPMGCTFSVVRNDYFYTLNADPINGATLDENFIFTNNQGTQWNYDTKYFKTKEAYDIRNYNGTTTSEVKMKFKFTNIQSGLFAATTDQLNWNYFLNAFISSSSALSVSTNAQSPSNTVTLTSNTWYWVRYSIAPGQGDKVEYSADGINYTLIYSPGNSPVKPMYMMFGAGASVSSPYGFSGEIDFKETNITINGEEVLVFKRNKR